jgi:uncharacterized protein (TIGR00725 family)
MRPEDLRRPITCNGGNRTGRASRPVATFLGGCVAASAEEEDLAYEAGRCIGELGFTFQHGGYNGLMEHAARGAAAAGAPVVAVTLRGKQEWGPLNPYVGRAVYAPDMGTRLGRLIGHADLVVAMGGGVGTLHELTAALWYAGNIRQVPVVTAGSAAGRLTRFLRSERWLYESPTRPLGFLHSAPTTQALRSLLRSLATLSAAKRTEAHHAPLTTGLAQRLLQAARVPGPYLLESGETLPSYFDPFRIAADPALSSLLADAMAERISGKADAVVGIALGGIVLAASLATVLQQPLLIVRTKPKNYGTAPRTQIEGIVTRGHRVILVDDVVRTGQHILRAARLLADAGLSASEALCVVERPGPGRSALKDNGISLTAMITDEAGVSSDGHDRVMNVSR